MAGGTTRRRGDGLFKGTCDAEEMWKNAFKLFDTMPCTVSFGINSAGMAYFTRRSGLGL